MHADYKAFGGSLMSLSLVSVMGKILEKTLSNNLKQNKQFCFKDNIEYDILIKT